MNRRAVQIHLSTALALVFFIGAILTPFNVAVVKWFQRVPDRLHWEEAAPPGVDVSFVIFMVLFNIVSIAAMAYACERNSA
jgi:hypothetical protein